MLKSVSKSRGGKGARRGLYNKVYGDGGGNARGTEVFRGNARLGEWTVLHYPSGQRSTTPSEQCFTIPTEQRSTIPSEQRSTYPSGRRSTYPSRRPTSIHSRRPTATQVVGLRVYIVVGLRLGKRVTCGLTDASPTG